MAKGAQDWVARTDLLLQTLSELIVRYKYGATQIWTFADYITSSGWNTLVSVSGKGIILRGFIDSLGSNLDSVRITIDGTAIAWMTLEQMKDTNIIEPCGVTHLLYYDLTGYLGNPRYVQVLDGDITFESSFKVEMDINTSYTYINGKLVYATI